MDKRVIVIASKNKGKIKDFTEALNNDFIIKTLDDEEFKDINFSDLDEIFPTLAENALRKAKEVYDKLKTNGKFYEVIADDSGLFIDALNGLPGVRTKRCAPDGYDGNNADYILELMEGKINRSAIFRSALVWIDYYEMVTHLFEAKCEIAESKSADESIFPLDKILKTSQGVYWTTDTTHIENKIKFIKDAIY